MLRILIADDEMIERKYLVTLFQKYPHLFTVVGEARNGREVVKQAALLCPDIIIMDINMPFCNGLTSANEIKKVYPNTIILLNTAYAEFEFARKAVEYQLDAYLLKPAKEEVILRTIETCLRKRRPVSEAPSAYVQFLADSRRTSDDPIELVSQYINDHPDMPLTLEELARIAHFSPPYLSRIFKEQKGITLSRYITQKRMENAKYLLVHSSMDIQSIATNCGFHTISHFNRVFKENTGQSPMEFRRQFGKQENSHANC